MKPRMLRSAFDETHGTNTRAVSMRSVRSHCPVAAVFAGCVLDDALRWISTNQRPQVQRVPHAANLMLDRKYTFPQWKRESRLGIHLVRALGRRGRDLDSMRTALKETEIRGGKITEGDWVVVWNASANRDEEAFANADTFNVANAELVCCKTKGLLHVERNRNGYLGGRPQSACADLPR
jgi:hypothetical protein